MNLAEPASNELAGVIDPDTLFVARTMQGTSPEKRALIKRVALIVVEG